MGALSDDVRCGAIALTFADAQTSRISIGLTICLLIGEFSSLSEVTAQSQVPLTAQPSQISLQFNTGHPNWVAKVASDLPHSRYASVGYDGSVYLWNSK